MKEKHVYNLKQYCYFTVIIVITFFSGFTMVTFSVDISKAIYNSINCCLTVIIPSLYGFMVLSGFIIKTNFYSVISKPFDLLSRYIFRIPTDLFSVFLISLFAGYPVGAKLINELRETNRITVKEAENMLCYCYASSPTFVIGLVGSQIFSSVKIGLYIYLSLILANIIIAFLTGLIKKIPQKTCSCHKLETSSQIFISSIESGAKALFQVCIMIVFFSIIIEILNKTGIITLLAGKLSSMSEINSSVSNSLIKAIFEISNLSSLPNKCFNLIPIITGIFSFGGLCIIFQIAALTKGKVKLFKFFLIRLLSGILSALISWILFSRIITEITLSVNNYPSVAKRTISPIPSIFLIIMTILLLSKKNVAKL